jgi:hypothetical protein
LFVGVINSIFVSIIQTLCYPNPSASSCYRARSGSVAHSKGCWIGLQDPLGTGNFSWISPVGLGPIAGGKGKFLDWRREEPNNHSISEGFPAGVPVAGGERLAPGAPQSPQRYS